MQQRVSAEEQQIEDRISELEDGNFEITKLNENKEKK